MGDSMSTIINATTTNGVVIQPDNSGSLVLQTNSGTTALTIDTSQNVGIGTASPSQKLEVAGGSVAASNFYTPATAGTLGTSTTSVISFGSTGSGGVTNTLQFNTNSTERMRIDSSGNVGIGTTSPVTKLHVFDSLTGGQFIVASSETNSTTKYGSFATQHYTNSEEPALCIAIESASSENNVLIGGALGEFNAASNIKFYTAANNTTTAGTERMRIDSTGNVSITQTPGKYTIDTSGGATSIANGGTVDFPSASGMLVANNQSGTGAVTIYLCGGGNTSAVSNVGTQVGTFAYNAGINGYRWTNNVGSTATFGFFFVRTRTAA
jgi:hypothetical protein